MKNFPDKTGTTRRTAFTIVELLVVISIIALLIGILVPSLFAAMARASNTRAQARVVELDQGARQYYETNRLYPGQLYANLLGRYQGDGSATLTGSQVLGACMFGYTYADIPQSPNPVQVFSATYRGGDLLSTPWAPGTRIPPNSLSDRVSPTGMALLYYPARVGVSGLTQYVAADNANGSSDPAYGYGCNNLPTIQDTRITTAVVPYNNGEFILIGAGPNRQYLDGDDLHNW